MFILYEWCCFQWLPLARRHIIEKLEHHKYYCEYSTSFPLPFNANEVKIKTVSGVFVFKGTEELKAESNVDTEQDYKVS